MRINRAVILTAIILFFGVSGNAHASSDLNNDGYPDIVVSNNSNGSSFNINSTIYWGAASNPYSTSTPLATHGAYGNSVADLNNDGYQDIVFSNLHNDSSFNTNSAIYWGAASNPYSTSTPLATHGAEGNSVADLNHDGYLDVVFSNYSNDSSVNINSTIYWGAASNPYATSTSLATSSADGSSIADLNNDGHLDIVFANFWNGSSYDINSTIYWGAESDPYTTSTPLATHGAHGTSVADLNHDGYLDIVFSNNRYGSFNTNSVIYWGAASDPYSTSTPLATSGAAGNSIADLNNDGYQDIVFSNYNNDSSFNINSTIYWGAASNPYSTSTPLVTSGATGNTVADLNLDGYLDIMFANVFNGSSGNINSTIYWGAASNPYSTSTSLATSAAVSMSVAGSPLLDASSGYGSVIPLWVTEGGYNYAELTSPVYQLIATKYYTLNSGALVLSDEDIAKLTAFYFDADPAATLDIGGLTWRYFSGDQGGGHSFGDTWYNNGTYYFYMNSGLEGGPLGAVPELPAGAAALLSLLAGARMLKKRGTI